MCGAKIEELEYGALLYKKLKGEREVTVIKEITCAGKYHSLPLEKGTVKLTLDTLNKQSDFRFPERSYLVIRKRTISFQNEILILGARLGEEKEERVYIRVLIRYVQLITESDQPANS